LTEYYVKQYENLSEAQVHGRIKQFHNSGIICTKKNKYKTNQVILKVLCFSTYTLAPTVLPMMLAPLRTPLLTWV